MQRASRLEAPSALLDSLGIRVVGTVVRNAEGVIDADRFIVPLHNLAGEVEALALAVPFLRPADVPSDPEAKGIAAGFGGLAVDQVDSHCPVSVASMDGNNMVAGRESPLLAPVLIRGIVDVSDVGGAKRAEDLIAMAQ